MVPQLSKWCKDFHAIVSQQHKLCISQSGLFQKYPCWIESQSFSVFGPAATCVPFDLLSHFELFWLKCVINALLLLTEDENVLIIDSIV